MSRHRVLITGGSGFIGSALIRHILGSDRFDGDVLNIDKLTYAANPRALDSVAEDPRYRFEQVDIVDLPAVEEVFERFEPDIAIHLAAETHVDRSIDDPFEFVQTNVVGTCNLLHASRSLLGRNADFRFLHVSTDEVYGSMAPGKSARTGDPYRPSSPYSASKAASDHMVRAFDVTYGLPVIVTNCTNNYGPYQFPDKLIPVMILNALAGRALPIFGDGRHVRDWLHVDDHARAIWLAAREGSIGTQYHVSGRAEKTNIEVVETICRILDRDRPRPDGRSYSEQIELVADRPGHDRRYSLDSSSIERELGWTPAVTFDEGMQRTVRWYAEQSEFLTEHERSAYTQRRGLIR